MNNVFKKLFIELTSTVIPVKSEDILNINLYLLHNFKFTMRKIYSFIALLSILSTTYSFAQTTKRQIVSGKIIFDISYPDSQFDSQTLAALPTESVMYFKNNMVKVDVSMVMGKTSVISDNNSGEGTMLMDMMGNKWAVKMNKEDVAKNRSIEGKPKVENTKESKAIAGYTCYKSIVTINTDDGPKSFDAWFTNDLKVKNSFANQIEGINGFMMEFLAIQNGMSMKMSARSVEPMEIADSEFKIPSGYEVKTMEDLQKMGGSR
jgi:hypothetical protein